MISMRRLASGAALTALACAMSSAVYAQETTGGVAGNVFDAGGNPVSGAQVQVTNTATGANFTTATSGDGYYTVRNLPVGGPYRVTVTASGQAAKSVTIPSIPIGQPFKLDVDLGETSGSVSELVVTGSRAAVANALVQTGPRSTFTAEDIQAAPTFARDLKDLTRINPLVTIDPANANAVIVAGANSRTNTIYVDGVRQSDDFGLNGSGYPTQRSPFSIDVVQAFNFEVAPYDVQYGNFQGGILNVVTKSGTNEFHGSAFFEQDSDRIAGNKIGYQATKGLTGRTITTKFKDQNYGATLGGPIIKDRLFFFGAYGKYKGLGSAGGYVPSDVSGANPIAGVTNADVTRVQQILKDVYKYDPLSYGGTGPVTDEKWFGKLDWYITDRQHLFVTYQKTEGTTYQAPQGSASNRILNLASNDYIYRQTLEAYTADLVSHWTDNFSTELEYTHKEVNSPTVLNTAPFAQFVIQLPTSGSIYLGPDVSRQANDLGNIDTQYKARAIYTMGQHTLTGGYEREKLEEFDLFVQNATGNYTFNSGCGAGDVFTNLQNRVACRLVYQNAFDNNPQSAGATIVLNTDTAYVQDEWRPTPELTLRAGLRYERFTTDDVPRLNPRFASQYGYPNTNTTDGLDIWMPRFGFNWQPDPTLTVTGGVGLFSGGNPGVWLYNSFQNTGNITGTRTYTCATATCVPQLTGVLGSSIPASAQADITASANLGTGNANAIAPGFKVPSTWKASISAVKVLNFSDYDVLGPVGRTLGDNWNLHADYYYSRVKEGVLWQDAWAEQFRLATPGPDGRPVYDPARYTNALNRTSGSDIVLTNTDKGRAKIWAVGFGKDWDNGFGFDYTYTRQDVTDVTSAVSSVAFSNYNNNSVFDPNHPDEATSNYEIKYEHKLTASFERKFFGDNKTTFRMFAYERAGLPYSYVFCSTSSSSCVSPTFSGTYDQIQGQSSTQTNRQLLYVPQAAGGVVTATSDPRVTYGPGFDLAAYNSFLQSTGLIGYAGKVVPRNAFKSRDVAQIDLHFGQEFPAFFPHGAKGEIYMDIINFGNLVNKNWGVINQVNFPYALAPVTARNCQLATGAGTGATQCVAGKGNYYQFDSFRPGNTVSTVQVPSSPPVPTWVIKLGVRYKF